jgi:dihydroorotase
MTSSDSPEAPFDLLVHGGQLVLPSGIREGSIGVRGGRIAAILPPDAPADVRSRARAVVDARGRSVLPGLIDPHVHFREPGGTHKETFETGTAAAAAGGYTLVADMPNTVPPTTTGERLTDKRRLLHDRAWVDVGLWGGAGSGRHVAGLVRAGAIGIKVYLGLEESATRHADAPSELIVRDDVALVEILRASVEGGSVVAVHCGNRVLRDLGRSGWMGQGFARLRDAIATESQRHKVETVARVLELAHDIGATVHIVHVPAPALPEIRRARDRGQRVTAESALPFMTHGELDAAAELGFDRYRSEADAELLFEAARDGTIDAFATDHAPHTLEEKRVGRTDLLAMPSGYPELETALPMLLDAVHNGRLTLPRLAALLGSGPARILKVAHKGELVAGNDADFVLVDMARESAVEASRFQTKARWSPFEGKRLVGWPVATFLRGEPVALESRLQGQPRGTFIPGPGGGG